MLSPDAGRPEDGWRLAKGWACGPARPARAADAADADAICEAMQRPNMRFVPVKSQDQQARGMVLRARQGFVTGRTACNR